MAIRIRKVKNKKAKGGFSYIALCAAEYSQKKGDIYLDDGMHQALGKKIWKDIESMGFIKKKKR